MLKLDFFHIDLGRALVSNFDITCFVFLVIILLKEDFLEINKLAKCMSCQTC